MRMMIGLLGLALCACTPLAPAAGPAVSPAAPDNGHASVVATGAIAKGGRVILSGERAFAVAELAYTAAANGVGRLVDAGVIRGGTATWVRARNAQARELLVAGKATADTARRAQAATELFGIAQALGALTEGR